MKYMTNYYRDLIILLLTVFIYPSAYSAIKLPGLVGDNMVLQRNANVPVWGWADAGEKVSVTFNGKTYNTQAAANDGKWTVTLVTGNAGGPYEMEVKGTTDDIYVKNILIGDVWLCGGQSNMVLDFNGAKIKALYANDIASSTNDQIRQIIVARGYSSTPAKDIRTSGWKIANPKNVISFSAAAYFFARNLYEKYHVPIGLINSSNGGTVAEAWTSEEGLKELPQCNNDIKFLKDTVALKEKIRLARNGARDWDLKLEQDDAVHAALWTAVDFDDSQWKTMKEPDFWDKAGYHNTHGTFWFRKTIDIPETAASKDAILQLGQLGDADITYFNGQQIGKKNSRDDIREYKIPASLVKTGKNVITIRIASYNGTGGMFPADTLRIKTVVSAISLGGDWKYQQGINLPAKPGLYDPKNLPTALYNAMIAPLVPYRIKGVIWYQGEYNTHKAYEYRKLFQALIKDWRSKWDLGNYPFIFEQLPNFSTVYDHPAENEWAELREAQSMALAQPNTAMAVAIDVGEGELHPIDKKDVGNRLALATRKLVYGEKSLIASGPVYKSMKIDGDKIILTFEDGNGKLVSKDKGELKYFAIAGDDKKFVWSKAVIKGNTIEVSAAQIPHPVAVRYAWAGNPDGCNLFNDAGLPASPFRTDDWAGLTVAN
jgi:sialate O-acetylesterase